MAKNFSQYDNDNPVMAILGAAEQELETNKSAAVTIENISSNTTKSDEEFTQENVQDTVIEAKRVLLNMNVRETTKKEWKMFFLEHDLSMTQGIETAVEYLISEVKKGNLRLTKGGITK